MFELVVYENEIEGKIYKHQDLLQGVPEKCFFTIPSMRFVMACKRSVLYTLHCISKIDSF